MTRFLQKHRGKLIALVLTLGVLYVVIHTNIIFPAGVNQRRWMVADLIIAAGLLYVLVKTIRFAIAEPRRMAGAIGQAFRFIKRHWLAVFLLAVGGLLLEVWNTPFRNLDEKALTLIVIAAIGGLAVYIWLHVWAARKDNERIAGWAEQNLRAHGTAHWMDERDILAHNRGLLLGRYGPKPIRYEGDGHLLTFAPTGSGKGVGVVIPNLLDYAGSILCIDPKGENAAVTMRRRSELGQAVHVLDPWGLSGAESAAFNPLDWLRQDNDDLNEDADLLADSLVIETGRENDVHWNEEAKALLKGLLLFVAIHEDEGKRHLGQVRALLNMPAVDFKALLDHMTQSEAAGGMIAAAANRFIGKPEKEAASILSTVQRQTHFLDGGRMQKVLERSDFNLLDLKRKPMTIYLVLPAERMPTHNRWLRLIVALSLTAMTRERKRPALPVLFLLDEFAALGKLTAVETAFGLARGYGAKIWPILQDLPQLKANYPDRWQSFIANAGALQAFGTADYETAEYLSNLIGKQTVEVMNQSAGSGGSSESLGVTGRALLQPEEIRRLGRDRVLALLQSQPPMQLDRLTYHSDPAFKGMWDRNPML